MGNEEKRGANWAAVEGKRRTCASNFVGNLLSVLDRSARSPSEFTLASSTAGFPVAPKVRTAQIAVFTSPTTNGRTVRLAVLRH